VYVPTEGIQTELHLFSDGRFPDVPTFALGNLDMRLHTIGKSGPENVDNVAIVNFNAVRDESDASKVQLFARVLNYRAQPVRVNIQVDVRADGRLDKVLPTKTIDLSARQVARAEKPAAAGKDEPPTAPTTDQPGETGVTF